MTVTNRTVHVVEPVGTGLPVQSLGIPLDTRCVCSLASTFFRISAYYTLD